MKARILALVSAALVMACNDARQPGSPTAPDNPSGIILDGAHGGNKDFFFLPPMVSNPSGNPNFEPGQFNGTLAPRLTVEICQLQTSPVNAQGLPVATDCVTGPPIKKFGAGTVQLQNPPDGFYQVLWNARESALDDAKFYRIKVLLEGSSTPFGVADLDPMSNMKEMRNAVTGEVIPLNDNSTLPIKFRIEHGGGSTLCGDAERCTSVTVSNNSPAGFQTVTVNGGAGAIAGARFPNGWLPANGPQSVVVTIHSVALGSTDPVTGAETTPCHVGLTLQQFPGCFNFSTTPQLAPIDESGAQFAQPVIVAVCYSLQGTGDPREKFAEMYSSGPNEPTHALPDASDAGILSAAARNCNTTPVIGAAPSRGLTQFASASWNRFKSGLGSVFGVKTAYGVDLGLGGFTMRFSNIGPAIAATIQPVNLTHFDLVGGGVVNPLVRIIGSNHHDGGHQNSVGLAGLPVTWTVAGSGGTVLGVGEEGSGHTVFTTPTNTFPIDPESPTSGGGYSAVAWTVPSTPGDYTLTANGPAMGGPVTFSVTVTAPNNFDVLQGTWLNDNPATGGNPSVSFGVEGSSVTVGAFGACVPTNCDWGTTSADMSLFNSDQQVTAIWNQGFVIVTQTMTLLSPTQLSIVNHYDFQPPDTRTDFTSPAETFTKATAPPPIP